MLPHLRRRLPGALSLLSGFALTLALLGDEEATLYLMWALR